MLPAEPIAITGIGCRYPGEANDASAFWRLMMDGVDAIREIPAERWNIDKFYDPRPGIPGKSISKWGGFIDHIGNFDAGFFRISAREAPCIDPQHRLLLQTAWEALEDAGETLASLHGSNTGVFVGISANDYCTMQASPSKPGGVDMWSATGGLASIAANRISFSFDLHGPSLAIDTACSSSLVALHLACESLRRGECPMALVGGVNALLLPTPFINFSTANMLSPDGRCKAFDAAANGYVRAEGAGVVVLKPLSAAKAAGDLIYAVVRGTASNQDGRNAGMTIPSASSQADLVRAACRNSGVAPCDVQYVEAHGTGTAVGDPVEASALGAVLGEGRPADRPCLLGSVKTNIGHLEAGAGVAGLIKAALTLHHGVIPPNLHCSELNPRIDFEGLGLRVVRETVSYRTDAPRIAGVNSFGFGGANAHALLEAAPSPPEPPAEVGETELVLLSARSEASLRALADTHAKFLGSSDAPRLSDLCATLATHRSHHPHRLAVLAEDGRRASARLGAYAKDGAADASWDGNGLESSPPVFVFSGQGSQRPGMGVELYGSEPRFRETIDQCATIFRSLAGWNLVEELRRNAEDSRLEQTEFAQPAIFAVQMGIASLLDAWGVRPAAVVGHSVGEVAAACACGSLTLEDAARVILERARSMAWPAGDGRMLSVGLPSVAVLKFLKGREKYISIGAVNSPKTTVLSGDKSPLEDLAEELRHEGVVVRWLPVKYSFHSHHVDPSRMPLVKALGSVRARRPSIRMVSTVHVGDANATDFDAGYWWANVRNPVFFAEAIRRLGGGGHRLFLEIGAQSVLARPIMESLTAEGIRDGRVLATLRREGSERAALLETVGRLHVSGRAIDWRPVFSHGQRTRLPAYRWSMDQHWREDATWQRSRLEAPGHPLLGTRQPGETPVWQSTLDLAAEAYLLDHRVRGQAVLPAAAYIETALACARELGKPQTFLSIADLDFRKPLILSASEEPILRTVLNGSDWRISSSPGGREHWAVHAAGRFESGTLEELPVLELATIRERLSEGPMPEDIYRRMATTGLEFGPRFRGIRRVWRKDGEALAEIETLVDAAAGYVLHPALLDSCLQVLSQALPAAGETLYLPVGACKVVMRGPAPAVAWCHATLSHYGERTLTGDICATDASGRTIFEVRGLVCRAVGRNRGKSVVSCYEWEWSPEADRPGNCSRAPSIERCDQRKTAPAPADETRAALNKLAAVLAPESSENGGGSTFQAVRDCLAAHPQAWPQISLLARAAEAARVDQDPANARAWTPAREYVALDPTEYSRGPLADTMAAFASRSRATLRALVVGADRAAAVARHIAARDSHLVIADDRPDAVLSVTQHFEGSLGIAWPPAPETIVQMSGTFDLVIFTGNHPATDQDIAYAADLLRPLGNLLLETQEAPDLFERAALGIAGASQRPDFGPAFACPVSLGRHDGYNLLAAQKIAGTGTASTKTEPAPEAHWVLFCDDSETSAELERQWRASGASFCIVRQGDSYSEGNGRFEVRAENDSDYERMAAGLERIFGQPVHGIIHAWNLGTAAGTSWLRRGAYSLAPLMRAWSKRNSLPRILVATAGAHLVAHSAGNDAGQGAAWGMMRVIANEFPRFDVRCVDLDPMSPPAAKAAMILNEAVRTDQEDEVAYRAGTRYVHRLRPISLTAHRQSPESVLSWTLSSPGLERSLVRSKVTRRTPGPGQVEIAVEAAGLNFRDVMKSLGIYPGDRDEDFVLGDECSGRIVAVGPDVSAWTPGDEVIAIAPGALSTRVLAAAAAVARKPGNLDFASAATVPVAFLTAWYALRELARIRPGEQVLVHAAAGGVGLAAVQIAQHSGANVIATAGSEEKRAFLRAIGVRHVLDSRGVTFGTEARKITGGRGVDVVLNSLSGEAIPCGLNSLAPHGRFVEIGKRDIYANSSIGLRAFRNGISLHAFDLGEVLKNRPDECRGMLEQICELIGRGELIPLPHRASPMGDAPFAFRQMGQGRHTGKIVMVADHPPASKKPFRSDATYLVTGGTRGFGFAVAEWMASQGAKHLILVSRNAACTEEGRAAVERLSTLGATAQAVSADIASEEDVRAVLRNIPDSLPLAGIFHAAAVIEDATIQTLTLETFDRVVSGKALGACNLDRLSSGIPLDHFVLFSSVALTLGNPGQGAYGAANGVLRSLADARRARGLPALCIDWGAIENTGYASRQDGLVAALARAGFEGLSTDEATAMLGRFLDRGPVGVTAARIDWGRASQAMPAVATSPKFSELVTGEHADDVATDTLRDSLQLLQADERRAAVQKEIAALVARVLRTTPAELDLASPLQDSGLDSLMAIELMNAIERRFELALPTSAISSSVTTSQITETVSRILTDGQTVDGPAIHPGRAAAEIRTSDSLPEAAAETEAGRPSLKHRAEAIALRTLQFTFRGKTQPQARRILRSMLPAARVLLPNELRWARKNLRAVFGPQLSAAQEAKLANLALEHHLLSYVEGSCGEGVDEAFENYQGMLEAYNAGRGVILCGVHLGSWEPLLRWAPRLGLPLAAVYRRAQNPLANKIFQDARASYGVRWISHHDTAAMASALSHRTVLAMMTDVNTWSGATFADFLGLEASCPSGPAALALHAGCPLVPAVAIREAGASRIIFGQPIEPTPAEVRAETVRDLTRRINAAFEPWIIEYAEQYNWMHPRWRARPDGSSWTLATDERDIARTRTTDYPDLAPRVRALIA